MRYQQKVTLHAFLAVSTPVIGLTITFTRDALSLEHRSSQSDDPTFKDDPSQIKKGYVAFGDSYAAGIGTGMTGSGGCRQGQFSYPKQLAKVATDTVGDIDFQNYPCSGAVISEVLEGGSKSQIDQWNNPKNADIATISIGGKDVGFYNVLTACVLRVGFFKLAGKCDEEVQTSHDIIHGRDLSTDINLALNQIIEKSGRDDFKVYVTGYPPSSTTRLTTVTVSEISGAVAPCILLTLYHERNDLLAMGAGSPRRSSWTRELAGLGLSIQGPTKHAQQPCGQPEFDASECREWNQPGTSRPESLVRRSEFSFRRSSILRARCSGA
jgi:hypothetical protein